MDWMIKTPFCAPSTSMLARLISIYVTYAEKNPQELHEDFF